MEKSASSRASKARSSALTEFGEGKFWFQRRGKNVTLGLTNEAIRSLGTVESVELPEEGEYLAQGDLAATIDGARGVLELLAPFSGSVSAVNEVVQEEPEVVSDDPIEEGWILRIEIEDPDELENSSPEGSEDGDQDSSEEGSEESS